MADEPFYKAHWLDIDPDRMSAYKDGFRWDDAAEALYETARISLGQTVADFGCGPGNVAVELANRVGKDGHVHALDINAGFLALTKQNAAKAGVAKRLTVHQCDGVSLPLTDGALDRITARNTMMYVDDPVQTLKEFRRVLRPGGLAHAVDGDWFMMVAEPVEHDAWRAFVKA
uniref:class I SAM-dependent methyltransferase n=1 Tax=Ruegeria arenilitoris TaxID=1173585 RepID=UPI00147CC54A